METEKKKEPDSEPASETSKGDPTRERKLLGSLPELEAFDFEKIEPDSACIYVGKRREGKTIALLNNWRALFLNGFLTGSVVVSKTENANMTYQQFILRDFIYTGWQPLLYQTIKEKMTDMRFLYDMKRIAHPGYVSVVLDDMISEKAMMYDRDLTDMFVAGRHYFLNVHITTQYPKAIPPRVRDNSDYVFMFRASGPANRLKLYEDFGSSLTKDEFFYLLHRYTKDFQVLVFRNRRPAEPGEIEMPGTWGGTQTAPTSSSGGGGGGGGRGKGDKKKGHAPKWGKGGRDRDKEKEDKDLKLKAKAGEAGKGVEIDEKGHVLDPDRFKDYFVVKYPFPIPEFRMGTPDDWEKQNQEKNEEADGLLEYYKGGSRLLEQIRADAPRESTEIHRMGAISFAEDLVQRQMKSRREYWEKLRGDA